MGDWLQQLIIGIVLGSVYALIALGYTMVYGVLRLINFAHGDVYMLGAFFGYFAANALHTEQHPSFWRAAAVFLIAMLLCALVGMAIERFAYRPLRQAPRLTALITAIGVSFLLEYGGQLVFGADPKSFPDVIETKPVIEWQYKGSFLIITNTQVIIVVVAFALMLLLRFIVLCTKVGKAMRAVAQDREAAALMGVNTDAVISFTFALGSALAAAGGILISLYQPSIDPLMGIMPGLKAFVAAVLGGIGNIPGAVLGGLLMGLAETFVIANTLWLPPILMRLGMAKDSASGLDISNYADAIAFLILIIVLLVRPSGLLGSVQREKV